MKPYEKIEMGIYGCTAAELREELEDSLAFKFGQFDIMVMGMLSDAQEMVAHCTPTPALLNEQRQLINRAKWAMRQYMMGGV